MRLLTADFVAAAAVVVEGLTLPPKRILGAANIRPLNDGNASF